MKSVSFLAAVAFALFAQSASAAVVGSLDSSRTLDVTLNDGTKRDNSLNGNYYSGLKAHIENIGSTVAAGTATVTAEYLSGVDLFISGTADTNASAAEKQALADWVFSGGVAFLIGDNGVQAAANSWMEPFGLSISGNHGAGTGRWTSADNALLDGVTGGLAAVAVSAGGAFAAGGAFDVLARYGTSATSGQIAIVGMQWGAGYIIASGDGRPFNDQSFTSFNNDGVTPSRTGNFVSNIITLADTPAPVPVPASLPLLAAALGAFGLLRRRARA